MKKRKSNNLNIPSPMNFNNQNRKNHLKIDTARSSDSSEGDDADN